MSDSKERLAESISALVDGEISEIEMHRVLKEVGIDQDQDTPINSTDSARGIWQRYNMVSASMSGQPVAKIDFSASISAAIDAEGTHRVSIVSGFVSSTGRFAIAASVAMVAILGVQQLNTPDPASADVIQFAEMDIKSTEQNTGPAIQFPSGFQPSIQARTVSAGGNNKTSQYLVPVVQVPKTEGQQFSEKELRAYMDDIMLKHSNNAALNSNQGMLPFARVTKSEARSSKE
ncbi:sigma-E factor negative regulatory protein [Porticoccaceae bacterium]|nr:sigma-E factor negative regulatory protein [Porticoccaceae bacterium]|tara:strand:+ start:344 stop:1042 length:699 start_codon:yes stop_codon:yes gene_type:complete